MANEDWPITGVAVVSDVRKCPAGYTLIDRTYGNSEEADLWIDGLFSRKVTRYLCVERGAPTPGRNVLVDVSIVNERDPIPPGSSVLETTADSGEKATKKKMMCVRWMNPSLTNSALSELIILSRNVRRPPNGYTQVGEVNNLMLCYKMSNIKTQSAMTPQNSDTSLNMSEVQNNLPYPLNPRVDTAGNQGSGAPYSAQGGPAGYNAYSQRPGPPERSLSILGQNTVTPLSGVTWKLSPRIENLTNMKNVKTQLQDRLQELQPLPEMLKNTELRLHESEDQLRSSEKKNMENARTITELQLKVEALTDQMNKMDDRLRGSQTENHSMGERFGTLERRLQEAEDQNRELLTTVARREEALHQNSLRLEDRERENATLTRQLENALTDLRRQQEQTRDKQAAKERTLQTRIVDLESQLSQTRAEVARLKREKEETERKFNSRLYDLKDRLEQSHSTNRSMQNYVQFLKNSYANVFGDSAVNMMPSTPMRQGYP